MASVPLLIPDDKQYERLQFEDEPPAEDAKPRRTSRRATSLVLQDVLLLSVHALQLVMFVQTAASRWPFPEKWLKSVRLLNLLSLDAWQYSRLSTAGAYRSLKAGETDSALMPYSYAYVLIGWAVIYTAAGAAFLIAWVVVGFRAHPRTLVRVARLRRCACAFVQVVALPCGLAVARLLHCRADGRMDTMNEVTCYRSRHWIYLLVGVGGYAGAHGAVAVWLRWRIGRELPASTVAPDRYEQHLRLRSLEYVNGVDSNWRNAGYPEFASFKKWASTLKPAYLLFCAALAAVSALTFGSVFAEAVTACAVFYAALAVALIGGGPYRVTALNSMLYGALVTLAVDCTLGALVASSQSGRNTWLLPDYLNRILSAIHVGLAVFWAVNIAYLVARKRRLTWFCCGRRRSLDERTIWPKAVRKPMHRKYVYDIKRARLVIERVLSTPAMFAPAHLLDTHIHVLNADCRRAERDLDDMHAALWDTLDTLISVHRQVSPKSLFSESVKDSIKVTSLNLLKELPAFSRRLAQREYFLLFASKVKRRILLKMFAISIFMRHTKQSIRRNNLTHAAMHKVWRPPALNEYGLKDFKTLYPEHEAVEDYEDGRAIAIEDTGETDTLRDTATWLKLHPAPADRPATVGATSARPSEQPPQDDIPPPSYRTESRSSDNSLPSYQRNSDSRSDRGHTDD